MCDCLCILQKQLIRGGEGESDKWLVAEAGGVFEEALAQATYFLEPGRQIAQTVRNEDIIDNVWTSGALSAQACCASLQCTWALLTSFVIPFHADSPVSWVYWPYLS